jgi:hypothetical protein
MEYLFVIFALLLLGWFSLDSLRAREIATEICRAACSRADVQLLDETVALRRLNVARTAAGLRLRRIYRFDFSEEGTSRKSGYLILMDLHLEAISLRTLGHKADPQAPAYGPPPDL